MLVAFADFGRNSTFYADISRLATVVVAVDAGSATVTATLEATNLRLDTNFYTVSADGIVHRFYKVATTANVSVRECGSLLASVGPSSHPFCDFATETSTLIDDLNGTEIFTVYDGWNKFSIVDYETGELKGGMIPDAYDILAEKLNFKPK